MADEKPGRKRDGTFKAGCAPGPGRPPDVHRIRELARAYGPEALETLVTIMRKGGKDGARAAEALLDRGFGKATTMIAGEEGGAAITVEIRKVTG
jgi:hypothetical protein